MNLTRVLMIASASYLGALGLIATFIPDVVLARLGAPASTPLLLMVQIAGALYLGFAGLNWMARANLIGGIYSRPVAIGNLMHFLTAALAILKGMVPGFSSGILWWVAVPYAVFALAFGFILFRHPIAATVPDVGPAADA
jgi:hypothetical protein